MFAEPVYHPAAGQMKMRFCKNHWKIILTLFLAACPSGREGVTLISFLKE
jgi:hypothetical protein